MRNKFTIEDVREFWDSVADKYENLHVSVENTHFQRFQEAIKYLDLKSQSRVLNVWSRTGEAVPYLKEKCPTISLYNLEVSPKFISIAKERFPQENVQATDLMKFPFPDGFFDVVIAISTIEHVGLGRYGDLLDTDGDRNAIKEIRRVMSSGGIILITVPFGKRFTGSLHRVYDEETLLSLLEGFELQTIEYFMKNRTWIKATKEQVKEVDSSSKERAIACVRATKMPSGSEG